VRMIRGYRIIIMLATIFFTLLSCEKDVENEIVYSTETAEVSYEAYSDDPLVTFLVDTKESTSIDYKNNLQKTLNYSKIPFRAISLEKFNADPNLGINNKVVVITEPQELSDNAYNKILQFIDNGGMLLLPTISAGEKFEFLAGVLANTSRITNTEAKGYLSKDDILPDFKNKAFKIGTILYGISRENFSPNIKVIATSSNDLEYPAIVQNDLGNGKVILMNTSQAFEKRDRGLLFSMLLKGLEGMPYSVANTTSIFLDDFPAPLYDMAMEPVHSEMNVTQAQFYTDHWWPDMVELGEEEGLVYSAYVSFDYRNLTVPPFTFEEWEQSKKRVEGKSLSASDWLMNKIKKSKHELAFHGYNHVSLLKNDWPSYDFMVLGLKAAKKRWELKTYGKLPVTYVPPSNNIDSLGFAALAKVFPSIKYNASLYLGDFKEGGNREYDVEPYNDHFFNFPRVTSGYVMDVANQYNQQNLYLYTGIWSHFIHADDIYQIPANTINYEEVYEFRNQDRLGWKISEDGSEGLFPRFKSYIHQTKRLYPLMRFFAVKDAAKIAQDWRKSTYTYSFNKDEVKVKLSMEQANWWFVYVSSKNSALMEQSFKKRSYEFSKTAFHKGSLYMIKTPAGTISAPRIFSKNNNSNISLIEQYEQYLSLEELPVQANPSENIQQLKASIKNSNAYNESNWTELFQYLSWNNSQAEIWPLLKEKYENSNKDLRYIYLAEKFIKGSDYPDLQTRKYWMTEKIAISNDPKTKMDYIGYFGEQDEVKLSAAELVQLIKDADPDNRTSFIENLIKRYPDEAMSFFNEEAPCENYRNSGEIISWFYADHNNFEKAIAWSNCSNSIDKATVDQWYLKTTDVEKIKARDYTLYINWLLINEPSKATAELIDIDPCNPNYKSIALDIAYAFGNQGSYRKAIEWSNCTTEFPVLTKLFWHAQLKQTQEIEALYATTKSSNEKFDEIQAFLVSYFISEKNYKKAWTLTNTMAASAKKEELRTQFNKDVLYLDRSLQKELLLETPELFDAPIAASIRKKIRITESDFIQLNGIMVADRLDPNYYEAKLGYGLRDGKYNTHIFSAVKNQAYRVPVVNTNKENIDRGLYGLDYQFQTAIKPGKFNYSGGARLEFDTADNVYYHLRAGASISHDSLYSAAAAFRRPALTGGAYGLKIYQTQINIYEELRINKIFRSTLYLEGNHYDDDGTVDATAALTFYGKVYQNGRSSISGFTEIAGLLGNNDKSSGYPYWTLEERLYGGIGAGYSFIIPKKDINITLDAAYFLDTFSDNFQRYRGSLSYPFYDKLYFSGNLEFYTLKNFYSNNFGIGLKYYLD